jgi:hypothetical protein
MSSVLINLIIQIVAGAIGGNVASGASKDLSLGTAVELAGKSCRQ